MLDYFSNPAWLAVLLGLVAVAVAIIIYLLQKQNKRFAYEVVSHNQLLTVREELENKLQVLYDGQPTTDICLLLIKLINNGNVAITTKDFEKNLTVSTGDNSRILSAAITDVEPRNLDIEIIPKLTSITISPTLFNAKDSFTLKVLVSDFSGRITVDGRIVGVRRISELGSSSPKQFLVLFFALLSSAVGILLLVRGTSNGQTEFNVETLLGILSVVLAYIVLITATIKKRGLKKIVEALVRISMP